MRQPRFPTGVSASLRFLDEKHAPAGAGLSTELRAPAGVTQMRLLRTPWSRAARVLRSFPTRDTIRDRCHLAPDDPDFPLRRSCRALQVQAAGLRSDPGGVRRAQDARPGFGVNFMSPESRPIRREELQEAILNVIHQIEVQMSSNHYVGSERIEEEALSELRSKLDPLQDALAGLG